MANDFLQKRGFMLAEPHRLLIASLAAFCIGNISGWILPDLINEFITLKKMPESQAGLIGSAELGALAISSMIMARFVKRASFLKILLIGTLVSIIATVFSLRAQSLASLLLLRTITGIGEGAALMVASAAVAHLRDTDRAYGVMNVVNILFGSALILLLPTMAQASGSTAAFPTLLLGLVVLAPFLFLMPGKLALDMPAMGQSGGAIVHHDISFRTYVLAGTLFLIALTSCIMWSFLVQLGERTGMENAAIMRAVALVAFLSVTGSLLATLLGARFGRLMPSIAGIVVLTASIVMLSLWSDPMLFRIAATVMVASTYFIIPYFMAYAAADDETGRGAALISGMFLLTIAVAPYIGGLLIENFGVKSIAGIVIATNALATIAIVWFNGDLHKKLSASAVAQ